MSSINRRAFLGASAALAGAGAMAAAEPTAEEIRQLGRTPHTRFAVNIEMWWRKLPFMERFAQAADFGYPAVEFWPHKGKDREVEEIGRLKKRLGIEIAQFTAWGFTPGLNDPKNHADFVKAVEDGCEVAKRLDCKLMTVVAGDDIPGMSQPQMHENIITGLKKVAPIAEKHQVMLILEPMNIRVDHKGHCLYGSRDALRICSEVNSPAVKINWDLYHMQISEGDLCGHLKEGFAAGHIGYLQLADHPGRNEPGTGEIHNNRVLKQAHDLGYRGFVGLECVPKGEELAAAKAVARADQW